MKRSLLLHFRPRRLPEGALRFSLTWGLGGMAALLVVQQMVSGLLLGFFYEPLPVQAYVSVLHIQDHVFLGKLVRNMHHWGGHGLVIVVFLHMLRVFLCGAFRSPRYKNWLVGLGLGLLILLANFSGYLLPWDQLSYWAVTIATSMLGTIPVIGQTLLELMRGGEDVGAPTLQLFHSVHTGLVPIALLGLMVYHFWFVRKAGGVLLVSGEPGETGKGEYVDAVPELLLREISFASAVICGLLLFSMFVDAPLGSMANPALTPPTVKAPWYFLGAQELLLHVPAIVAVCILPLFVLLFLLLFPLVGKKEGRPAGLIRFVFFGGLLLLMGLTFIGIFLRGEAMTLVLPW